MPSEEVAIGTGYLLAGRGIRSGTGVQPTGSGGRLTNS